MEYTQISEESIPEWMKENLVDKETLVYFRKWSDRLGDTFDLGIYMNPGDMRHDRMIGTLQCPASKTLTLNQPQNVWVERGWLFALNILIEKAMIVGSSNNCYVQFEIAGNNSHNQSKDGTKMIVGKDEPNFPHVHFYFRRATNTQIFENVKQCGEKPGELINMRNKVAHDPTNLKEIVKRYRVLFQIHTISNMNQTITQEMANDSAKEGRITDLKLLENKNVLPNVLGANFAASGGHLEILAWLEDRSILPDITGANLAVEGGHTETLKWLKSRDILPDEIGANYAVRENNLETLIWLDSVGISPHDFTMDCAACNGYLEMIKWFASKNVLPSQDGANLAAKYGFLDVLVFLETKDILPNEKGARWAVKRKQQKVVDWLNDRGIGKR